MKEKNNKKILIPIVVLLIIALIVGLAACKMMDGGSNPPDAPQGDPVSTELDDAKAEYMKKIDALDISGVEEDKTDIVHGIIRKAKSDIEMADSEDAMEKAYASLEKALSKYGIGEDPAENLAGKPETPVNPAAPTTPANPTTPATPSNPGSTGGSSGSGSSGGSSGSSGSGSSSGSGGSSTGSSSSPTPHVHSWVNITEQRWVVDVPAQEAWTEYYTQDVPIIEYYYAVWYVDGTMVEYPDSTSAFNEYNGNINVSNWGGPYQKTVGYETKTYEIPHPAVPEQGHYETVVTGQRCTGCGATQ